MAWASTLEKGATITTSRDTSRAGARAQAGRSWSGCNAAGVNVDDLEAATVPVTRFQVRSGKSLGGITVRLFADDPQSVVIRFFDQDGIDVDESTQRKIERLYHREDFRRVLASEIGDIGFPPRTLELLHRRADERRRRRLRGPHGLKMVLDYSFGTTSFVMPNLLAKLEAEVLVVNPLRSHGRGHGYRPRRGRARTWPSWCAPRGRTSARSSTPAGSTSRWSTTRATSSPTTSRLLLLLDLVVSTTPGARVALPVAAPMAAEEICAGAGAEIVWTKLSPRT